VGTAGVVVDVTHLVKTYPGKPPVRAASDISFQVERSEIFGFLGR
jgi:ABC-type Na+ transport system ATPase subunit NatA